MEAQDIVEMCAIHAQGSLPPSRSFSMLFSCKFRNELKAIHMMGTQIKKIKGKLNKIEKRAHNLTLLKEILVPQSSASSPDPQDLWRRSSLLRDEPRSVDIDRKIEEIVGMVNDNRVVAVVGMGGSGKTRLLQHVFNSLKSQFCISIWLCFSQTYTVRQLQADVLSSLNIRVESEASNQALQEKIHEELRDKRCLVVLDDVWDLTQREKSQCTSVLLKLREVGLPETEICKVLVSTRDHGVALQLEACVYQMPLLSPENSHRLFFKHCFPNSHFGETLLSADQAELIKETLKRCGGLPLAVIAIAGVLRHQQPDNWDSTLEEMKSASPCDTESVVITALRLSFNALEYRAKPCFSYLGVLGEEEVIVSEKLIGLWRAEGLVDSEDEGRRVCMSLANRSLIQIHRYDWNREYGVRIHDLVRDLAVIICRENRGFCKNSCGKDTLKQLSQLTYHAKRISRVSYPKADVSQIPHNIQCPSSVRTLRLNDNRKLKEIPSQLLANAGALRALDLRRTGIQSLPDCVGKLKLLKFLDISGTRLYSLPECIRHLKLLEYLYTHISCSVPSWVAELEYLTHFSGDFNASWENAIVHQMRCLKVVRGITIEIRDTHSGNRDAWTWNVLSHLMPQLQDARLFFNKFESHIPPKSVHTLQLLNNGLPTSLPDEWKNLNRLQHLGLDKIQLPTWILGFHRLKSLILGQHQGNYPAEVCALPELRRLELWFDSTCEHLPNEFGKAGAFPKLRSLLLVCLDELKALPRIEDGGMPSLEELRIERCANLKDGFGWKRKVRTLGALQIQRIGEELANELQMSYREAKLI
eukprot:TRINITY_DN7020_c0_g1_i2.p1 TRINITY_DN7020_c0_g1~~TRINITY_DN7020_c0_g1_i2.p1  ORF type:complete len:813 (+),score=109.82 TRINITY_DN7020_c0_g1_i2:626-3064(+)